MLLCLPEDPCCSPSGRPFITPEKPVNRPVVIAAFARISSKPSGFFFCGIRLLPVVTFPKLEEAEFFRRVDDPVFSKPAGMNQQDRGIGQELQNEIAIAGRVEAVAGYLSEA